jgi:hypothetical protein
MRELFGQLAAGLLPLSGLCITRDRAAIMENGGIRYRREGRCQAEGGEGCKDHVFHRNAPFFVERDVRLQRQVIPYRMRSILAGLRIREQDITKTRSRWRSVWASPPA